MTQIPNMVPTHTAPFDPGLRRLRIPLLLCFLLMPFLTQENSASAQTRAEPSPNRHEQTEDLADRLIRGESANEDIMARIVGQMTIVEQRLSSAFDPGAETQRLQRRILDRLDEAIAASVRHGSRGGASSGAMGDMRRRTPKPMDRPPNDGTPQGSGERATGSPAKGDPQQTDRSGPLRDSRRGWGHLPLRDRDEVLQGINEKSLERFRQWIDRYYRALADKDDQ